MYDGKQVVTLDYKMKKSYLYNIGKEMTDRKGTGNYEDERTKFNVSYVSMSEKNLYQEVKQNLIKRNIEYIDKPSTNFLNGVVITSGPEFFQSLGMKFVDSGRTYHSGNKKGQSVLMPKIKSNEDIPNAVTYFFDSCMDFLKDYVGEENIVLAQVHYDEDTPHLQAYFIPVVDKVKRKCYEKDKDGNVVKEESNKKDGTPTLVPKILRDDKGNIIYEEVNGKFLNCDQFWKDRGGKSSFHQMQNKFNKFITERGFNLDRGEIGANKEKQSKLDYDISEKKAELEELRIEKENTLNLIKNSRKGLKELDNLKLNDSELLNPPKRKLGGYKEEDVLKIIDYTKDLESKVVVLNTDNKNKEMEINKLTQENKTFKSNDELIKRNKLIEEQKQTIKEQKNEINRLSDLVNVLNNNISNLKEKFNEEIEKWKNRFSKLCNAIDKVLHREPKENVSDYENLADAINYGYYRDNRHTDKNKDDYEIEM